MIFKYSPFWFYFFTKSLVKLIFKFFGAWRYVLLFEIKKDCITYILVFLNIPINNRRMRFLSSMSCIILASLCIWYPFVYVYTMPDVKCNSNLVDLSNMTESEEKLRENRKTD